MPNWCQNRLIVEGPAEDVERFRAQAAEREPSHGDDRSGEVFSIQAFVPEPPPGDPRRVPTDACEGGWDWYNWRRENWGTKWDVSRSVIQEERADRLILAFETAWAPTLEATRRIALAYPLLTITHVYLEAGAQFHGSLVVRGDDVLAEAQASFDAEWPEDRDEEDPETDPLTAAIMAEHGFGWHA